MRFTPSTKSAALFLSTLRTTSKAQNIDPKLAKRVLDHSTAYLEQMETGEVVSLQLDPDQQAYYDIDTKMAALFVAWGTALANQDGHKAVEIADELDALAEEHSYDYPEAKSLFYQVFGKSNYTEARNNYISATGKHATFGVIQNTVSETAKIGIIGDWGTGTQDAKKLFKDMMNHRPAAILHLGDIYEAGVALEIEEFYIKPMTDACKELGIPMVPIFSMAGNHEYFSAGKDYFEMLKILNRDIDPNWAQEASFFCLRSADNTWQFIGADTGLGSIDHSSSPRLEPSEQQWHHERIAEFPGKTVFMTHHQLLSVVNKLNHSPISSSDEENYKYYNRHLVKYFSHTNPNTSEPYFNDICLWLWGHDHHFTAMTKDLEIAHKKYGTNPILRRGQLLGGSAREVKGRGTAEHHLRKWVEHDSHGTQIAPSATNPGLRDHTYGILDLGKSRIDYYQTPAWYDSATDPIETSKKPHLYGYDI